MHARKVSSEKKGFSSSLLSFAGRFALLFVRHSLAVCSFFGDFFFLPISLWTPMNFRHMWIWQGVSKTTLPFFSPREKNIIFLWAIFNFPPIFCFSSLLTKVTARTSLFAFVRSPDRLKWPASFEDARESGNFLCFAQEKGLEKEEAAPSAAVQYSAKKEEKLAAYLLS